MLTQIAACEELFHTATGTAFADLLVDGHRETWPIRSKRFRGWLRRRYYEATGSALNGQAISSELDLLEARAQFDVPERSVHVRVAEHDGHVFLDLAEPPPDPVGAARDDSHRPGITAADDADGADANAALHFG
jgi:hypothetical protein